MRQKTKLTAEGLIVFQIYYNIICKFIIWDLGFPAYINYFSDLITVILIIYLVKSKNHNKARKEVRFVYRCVVLYYLLFIPFSLLSGVSPILSLWSLRNNLRFYIWIIITACFLKRKNVDKLFSNLNLFIVVNLMVIIVQFVVLGLRDDRLNGLFGSYVGGNAAVNTFSIIMTCENISAYFNERRKLKRTIVNILLICVTCAMNELKYYFVELLIIVLAFVLNQMKYKDNTKAFGRAVKILVGGTTLVLTGYFILLKFYPGFRNFFEREVLLDYLTRSYNSSDLIYEKGIPISNRFTIYNTIQHYFLNSPLKFLFGLGLGTAEYTAFFESDFFSNYKMIGVNNYSYSHTFLETGFVGVIIVTCIYLYIAIYSWKKSKIESIRYYCLISFGCAITGILMNAYNSALRIESSGYIFFTAMSLTFCIKMREEVRNVKN